MHHEHSIADESKQFKPDIILDYNNTKSGVDILDKLIREYTCRRSTRRWPLTLFLNFVDIAAYNAFVIWRQNTQNDTGLKSMKHARKQFLEELGRQLVGPQLELRTSAMENTPSGYKGQTIKAMELSGREIRIAKRQIDSEVERPVAKRGRCSLCSRSTNDNKYSQKCQKCSKFICKSHTSSVILCNDCHGDEQQK